MNIQDRYGETPLHISARKGFCNICQWLIESGCNINVKGIGGKTPLHIAVEKNDETLVKLLLKNNADVNIQDWLGKTPLDVCARRDFTNVTQLLIESGCNISLLENDAQGSIYQEDPMLHKPAGPPRLGKVKRAIFAKFKKSDPPFHSPGGPSSLGEVDREKLGSLGKVTEDPLWDIPAGPLRLGKVGREKLDPLLQKPTEPSSHGEAKRATKAKFHLKDQLFEVEREKLGRVSKDLRLYACEWDSDSDSEV